MRGFGVALLALVALEGTSNVSALVPTNLRNNVRSQTNQRRGMTVDMSVESDVSIPYDAAAQYEYENWCKQYGKEADPVRYEVFKDNYEAITVMNVAAKKTAREAGDDTPSILALNEYADCTAEEYEAAMNGGETDSAPASTGDILGKAVEAAESQMAASSALQEAADALAEEEQVGC